VRIGSARGGAGCRRLIVLGDSEHRRGEGHRRYLLGRPERVGVVGKKARVERACQKFRLTQHAQEVIAVAGNARDARFGKRAREARQRRGAVVAIGDKLRHQAVVMDADRIARA
jgi:hypothetical protein